MKKIKDTGINSTPKDFQGEYPPIATPLNTEMFKEKNFQDVYLPIPTPIPEPEPEPDRHFVLHEAEPQFVLPEPHFVLPQTPSPIPTLSAIPEPQQTKYSVEQQCIPAVYEHQLSQMESQNIYDQLIEQQQREQHLLPYNDEQDPLQQFLTQPETNIQQFITQPETNIQQFITQPETNNVCEEKTNDDDVVMSVITEVLNNPIQVNRTGKNISMLKRQHCLKEEEEEEEEEELRTTTKNNKRFHKHLILKKKDDIVKKFPILSQKNSDLIVSAENKYKELKSIFVLKKKYIEKNKELKEHIYGLELVEHRYRCETERLNKKIKK